MVYFSFITVNPKVLTMLCCPVTLGPTFLSLSCRLFFFFSFWSPSGNKMASPFHLNSHLKQMKKEEGSDKTKNNIFPITPSEKAMAPQSHTLAWKIPWVEEPGRLQSMGSLRVRHDWATSLWLFTFMHWRRKWQPTPVFLPGESQGRGSLGGCGLWDRTE